MIKLYVEEERREIVFEAVEEAETVATSTVAYAEARSGLARRFREGHFTNEEYRRMIDRLNDNWKTYDRLTVSNSVSRLAGEMAERHALRGFDSIHLASAKRLETRFDDLRFLAFDERLTDAAKDAGIPTYGEE